MCGARGLHTGGVSSWSGFARVVGGVAVCPAHCKPPAACASCGLAIPRYRSVAPRSPSSRCCAPRLTPAKPSGVCLFRGIQPRKRRKTSPRWFGGFVPAALGGGALCVCAIPCLVCSPPSPAPRPARAHSPRNLRLRLARRL